MERFGWNLSLHTHTLHSPFPYLLERPSPIRLEHLSKMVPSGSTASPSGSTAGMLAVVPLQPAVVPLAGGSTAPGQR